MALIKTPICNFGDKAKDFNLLSTYNKNISLNDIRGKNAVVYVQGRNNMQAYDERNNLHDHVINRHHRSSLVVMALSTP